MKPVSVLVFLSTLCSCSQKENKHDAPVKVYRQAEHAVINYDSCKKIIQLNKRDERLRWSTITKAQKERIFTAAVTETIIPAWIGTAWDFNGTTEKPQQGSIACGYFVTTILRDAGLSLARVKLAQCASEQMIVSLVQPKYIQRFSQVNMEDFTRSIDEQGYGLYIVGLDNHIGFIYNDGRDTWFIHSTFVGTRNVQKEKVSTSWILEKSKYKVLAKISADERVLNRWIN